MIAGNTSDLVALFIVVPFTVAASRVSDFDLEDAVILEIVATNLIGCVTPLGNPQNLFDICPQAKGIKPDSDFSVGNYEDQWKDKNSDWESAKKKATSDEKDSKESEKTWQDLVAQHQKMSG